MSGLAALRAQLLKREEELRRKEHLGYSETEAFKAVQKVDGTPDMNGETLLKLALKQMLTF